MQTRFEWIRRAPISAICTVALLVATSGIAFANAMPTTLSPGDGALVTARPSEVSIDTAEQMSDKAGDNELIVRDAANARITSQSATVAPSRKHMSVGLPATLAVGTYSVQWFTVSAADGHAASGQWKFTYDPSKLAAAGSQPGAAATHADGEHADDEAHDDAEGGLIVPLSVGAAVIVLLGGGILIARRRA